MDRFNRNAFFIDYVITISALLFLIGLLGSPYWVYKYEIWKSPCSEVYNEGKLIYKGNSYFYKTESRGTSTIYKEYDKRFFFPRMKKEIMSNTLTIKTCEE